MSVSDNSGRVSWTSLLCCVASLVLPAIIVCSFERNEPTSAAVRPGAGYLHLHHAGFARSTVKMQPVVIKSVNATAKQCTDHCDKSPRCAGFVFHSRKRKCWESTQVSAIVPGAHLSCSLRQHASWPRNPSRVRWKKNATLVMGWAGARLGWLRELRDLDLDLALIAALPVTPDGGRANGSLASQPQSGRKSSKTAPRAQPRSPRELMRHALAQAITEGRRACGIHAGSEASVMHVVVHY
mgnify:CR=1 FL=1|jgi:hypothetical protein